MRNSPCSAVTLNRGAGPSSIQGDDTIALRSNAEPSGTPWSDISIFSARVVSTALYWRFVSRLGEPWILRVLTEGLALSTVAVAIDFARSPRSEAVASAG